jgi:arylsulfatase A-like enzyme
MKRRYFLKLIGTTASGLVMSPLFSYTRAVGRTNKQKKKHPNILFIMADDHTTQAISCYGGFLAGLVNTRNIDRITREGVMLKNCFCTNSICSPSRATILTGMHSHKNGVRCLGQSLGDSLVTFPELFQQAGYQTAVFGKWHLRSIPRGFDSSKVLQVQGRYKDPQFFINSSKELETVKGWSTDIIADMTMDFIRKRDKNKPFMTLCHFKATHDPWDSREPYKSMFKDIEFPEPDNLYDTYKNRSMAAKNSTLKLEMINQSTYPHDRLKNASWRRQRKHIYQQYIKDFIRCGRTLDENVGRLLDFLDTEGLSENTIVIYTADQGHFLGEHGFFSKRFMYDEAMRMPFLIRYKRWFKPGTINEDMITNVDFAPTLLDMAGIAIPETMQGKSFKNNLLGSTAHDWPKAVYYHYWQHLLHRNVAAHYGIRTKSKKLIFYYGLPLGQTNYKSTQPEWELFDLAEDPHEMKNVYDDPAYSDVIAELKEQLLAMKRQVGDTDEKYPELMKVRRKYWNLKH